ncbi:unnamed protein product [Bursaphelenchus okinawaensis]|uniref:Uncharacterized protein n=1 Tax=Bursaphelenchus okinawaensis TaxID=465554 RepID=A0A811JQ71_9BILA|nr:unnamed protein product [Bursaphelenchus okinawaensis]CAG9077820.1 unnamed protein product [Bursaphelenchus okinawaensis]
MAFCFSEEFNRKGEKLTQRKFDFCKTFLCAGFYRNPKELSLHHKGKVVLHLVNDTCYKRSNSTYYGIAMNYLMAKVFHRPIHYTNVEERLNPDLFTDKGCEPWNVITKCDYYDDE